MPRFRDHRYAAYRYQPLEQYQPPRVPRGLLRGMLIGGAIGTAMWVVAVAASYLVYELVTR